MGNKYVDIAQKRFGHLVAIEPAGYRQVGGALYWRCFCDCVNEVEVLGTLLRKDTITRCGRQCIYKAEPTIEGRLSYVWSAMKQRCENPKHRQYVDYGGRGITVCLEWSKSFEAFMSWSLDNGFQPGLSIDRINNDGPYSPDNCRWADTYTQRHNRRPQKNQRIKGV